MSAQPILETHSLGAKARAWGVHVFTLLGLPLAFVAAVGLAQANAGLFFGAMWATAVIDSVDGTLARKARVKQVVPQFDGALLDNIIDFLTFVFLPVLALPALGLLPGNWIWWAMLPLMASGYQFCQAGAKTDESFVGFPSYWNVVVIYLFVLDSPPWFSAVMLSVFAVLVFIPTHYLYPSRTLWMRPLTVVLGGIWGLCLIAMCVDPNSTWAETLGWVSLYFPAYYFVMSFIHDRRIRSGAYVIP
jgi:phosphatidylcholine synthase